MTMCNTYDVEHRYDNYIATACTEQGRCRVRVYEDDDGVEPPIVVLTQIDAGIGVSVTNASEYLCAEVAFKFLWPKLDARTVWVEHYTLRTGRREICQRVRFDDPYPLPGVREAGSRKQIGYGTPDWEPLSKSDVEKMIGEPL